MTPGGWVLPWIAYIPFPFKGFKIHELSTDILVAQVRFILLQQPTAYLRIFSFRDGIFDVGLFEAVERDDDAVDLRKGVVQVSFGGCFG